MKKVTVLILIVLTSFVSQAQMVLEYNTNLSAGTEITVPINGTSATIDWGDGSAPEDINWPLNVTHTYASEGIYTVSITGSIAIYGSYLVDNYNLTRVIDFGDIGITNFSYAFHNATNLTEVPTSLPNNVNNINYMFEGASSFNQDINSWNLSNITSTRGMFKNASSFNGNISNWNTSNITDMSYMFNGASEFNQDISGWNVNNVTNMAAMFYHADEFNSDISNWNVDNVTNMYLMFCNASAFNQDISAWNVSNVSNMHWLFNGASEFNQNIGSWDVSNVTDMSGMFQAATNFNQDISSWDVSNVTNMSHMFFYATSFNQNINSWNVSNVTNMYSMFYGATEFNQSLNNWNVSNVTNMEYLFGKASAFNQDISTWDVSSVTKMTGMFYYATNFNQDISTWDVSNVTNMNSMFDNATNFNQNIGAWNTGNVIDMQSMFHEASTFNQNLSNWDVSNVTNMQWMFHNIALSINNYDSLLIGWANQTLQPNIDFDGGNSKYSCNSELARNTLTSSPNNWIITDGGNIGNTTIITQAISQLINDEEAVSFTIQAQGVNLTYQWRKNGIDISDGGNISRSTTNELTIASASVSDEGQYSCYITGDCGNVTSNNAQLIISNGMPMTLEFNADNNPVKTIALPLQDSVNVVVDWGDGTSVEEFTSPGNVEHVYASGGIYTVSISGYLSHFGASYYNYANMLTKVISFGDIGLTDLSYAFHNAINLTEVSDTLPLTVINTSNMFRSASSFNHNIGDWNVSNVTDMNNMFRGASAFNQDIGNWNVSNVTNMREMFSNASNFNQDIGNWDVSSVTDMVNMFANTEFNQDIGSWDMSNVNNMTGMFSNNTAFNQDISNWDITGTYTISDMFYGATSFNQDISNWDVSNVQNMLGVFYGATNFNQDLSNWDVSSATSLREMFYNATSFNQNIGSWNVSNVTDMTDMFEGVTLSTQNYDSLLIGWANLNLQPNINFNGGNSIYSCDGAIARNILTNTSNSWTITDGGFNGNLADITTITNQAISQDIDTITDAVFTINATGVNLSYQWQKDSVNLTDGGNISGSTTNELTLTNVSQADLGKYNCVVTGDCGTAISNDAYLTEAMKLEFNTNLGANTSITIKLGGTVDVDVDWGDGSPIEHYTTFGNVDHTYATDGIYIVKITGTLTQYGNTFIPTPNVEKLTKVLSFGNVGLTSLAYAFHNAENLTEVPATIPPNITNMEKTFSGASSFNSDISNWDVSSVTNMIATFERTDQFNQDISNWDVSNVTNMFAMFDYATVFNQDIGGWDVGNVTNMVWMLSDMDNFNQDISNWDVSNVTDMKQMFYDCVSFDQNLGNWNISNVTNLYGMFHGVTLSVSNYDSLLIGWANQTLQPELDFGAGNSQYSCVGAQARNTLTNPPNIWTISDAGQIILDNTVTQDSATFTANGIGQNYQWLDCDNNNAIIPGATNQSFTATTYGSYSVEVSNGNCIDTSICMSFLPDTIVIINPNNYGSANQEASILISNCTIDYNNVDSANIYNYSYINDSTTQLTVRVYYNSTYTEIIDTINTPVDDVYEVEIIIFCPNKDNGVSAIKIIDYIDTGIFTNIDNLSLNNIVLYPNPTTGKVQLIMSNKQQCDKIEIVNVNGVLVKQFKIQNSEFKIDLSQEAKGVYFVKVFTINGIIIKKLIIE